MLVFALSLLCFLLAVFISTNTQAAPTVSQPNGVVHEAVEDLRVKVLGGWVTIARTYAVENVVLGGGKWYFNAAWADLQFTYDSLDGSVRSINRLDSQYDKGGNGIYIFYRQDFIKATPTGWRWYNTAGDWITYNAAGRITAYGDRNNIQVNFEFDSQNRPLTIKDHFGNIVFTYTYTADKLTKITDRANRQVQYSWTGSDLTQVTDVLGNNTRYEYVAAVVPTGSGATGSIGANANANTSTPLNNRNNSRIIGDRPRLFSARLPFLLSFHISHAPSRPSLTSRHSLAHHPARQ